MTKIEKMAIECASGKNGDAYEASKNACFELTDMLKEYLETKCPEIPVSQPISKDEYIRRNTIKEIFNELFTE